MVTAAKAALEPHILHQPLLVGEREVHSTSPCYQRRHCNLIFSGCSVELNLYAMGTKPLQESSV